MHVSILVGVKQPPPPPRPTWVAGDLAFAVLRTPHGGTEEVVAMFKWQNQAMAYIRKAYYPSRYRLVDEKGQEVRFGIPADPDTMYMSR